MRAWIDWLKGAGLAAVCILAVGCGGGETPDAETENTAAAEGSEGGGAPPEVAPGPPVASAPGMPPGMRPGMRPGMAGPGANEGEGTMSGSAVAEGSTPPAVKGGEGGSATAEMLALATGGQGGGGTPSPDAQPGASGPGGPGGPGGRGGSGGMMAMMGGRPGAPGVNGPGAGMSGPGGQFRGMPMAPGAGGPSAGAPAAGGPPGGSRPGAGVGADMMARMMQQQNRGGQGPGGPGGFGPGRQGGLGGFRGPQQDNGPADVHSPTGAARAFLNALRDKDRTRLAEATALRSSEEAVARNQDLFRTIVDESISDSELDDLAKRFEGYKVAGENAVKSTGRLGIILHRDHDDGGYTSMVLTVRKEKKGWGVMDMSKETEFKAMAGQRRRTGGRN